MPTFKRGWMIYIAAIDQGAIRKYRGLRSWSASDTAKMRSMYTDLVNTVRIRFPVHRTLPCSADILAFLPASGLTKQWLYAIAQRYIAAQPLSEIVHPFRVQHVRSGFPEKNGRFVACVRKHCLQHVTLKPEVTRAGCPQAAYPKLQGSAQGRTNSKEIPATSPGNWNVQN